MHRRLVIVLLCSAVGCTDTTLTTAPDLRAPGFEIADATRNFQTGFYWLPPIVRAPAYAGTFDAGLSPTVEICELAGTSCGAVIATYTTTSGPGGETVRMHADEELYHVNWHTDQFPLSADRFYRVSVHAGARHTLLGFADVQPVNNGSGLKNVDSDQYIGLVDGRTLPIKFRIETGIVAEVEVQPLQVETDAGGTQQFVAVLRDLHGQIVTGDVRWASSDEAVATIDQTGLATAIADGATVITASTQRATASAALSVAAGGVIAVAAGNDHNCALAGSQAFCWGEGNLGQLGDGAAMDRFSPTAVVGGIPFNAIDAGGFHACALTDLGEAYYWGLNSSFQIGVGESGNSLCDFVQPCRPTPTAVSGGLHFTALSAGSRNTCALTADHEAYCWGDGFFGALGNGTQTRSSTPQLVLGGHAFGSISVGLDVTCGVTLEGQGYCWGTGSGGMLGNGSTARRLTPFPVAGGLTFASITVGVSHTCGLTTSGRAYCWGVGAFGKLGNNSTANQLAPVPVSGDLTFASLAVGALHTCGLTTSGHAWCWGTGADGRLGAGPIGNENRLTPMPVAGDLTFASLTAGQSHTCGIATDEQAYCWGLASSGQMGNGSGVTRDTPTPIASLHQVADSDL